MNILVTTTGSYPPVIDEKGEIAIEPSIKRAIEDQIRAGVDILVDGQVRSDIVGIFAREIGLHGTHLPYSAPKILQKPEKSSTLDDLQTAAQHAKGKPIKAGENIFRSKARRRNDKPTTVMTGEMPKLAKPTEESQMSWVNAK